MRPKISAIVITKNEEENLPGCLESISWVDEIIIVDDNSTDRTVEIARNAGSKVFVNPMGSYPAQRNFGLVHCTFDWVLWIDADERVPVSLRDEILYRLEADKGKYTAYYMLRQSFLLWRKVRWTEWSPRYHWFVGSQMRLVSKDRWRYREDKTVHEVMTGEGLIGRLQHVLHDARGNPTLHRRIQKTIRYALLEAQMEWKQGRRIRWYDFAIYPFWGFFKSFIYFGGFLEGTNGWIIAWCSVMTEVCKCFYVYEQQQDPVLTESRRKEVQELWKTS